MSIQATTAVWAMTGITPTEKLVLLKIADHTNDNGLAWPSLGTIAKDTGLSRSTVCAVLDSTEEAGFLIRQRGGPKGQKSNRYRIKWSAHATSSTTLLVRPPDLGSPPVGHEVVRQSDPNHKRTVSNRRGGSKARGTRSDFQSYASDQGMPETDGEALFDHYEANGWKTGKNPVKDWRAGFRTWKANGWLASQKGAVNTRKGQPATGGRCY